MSAFLAQFHRYCEWLAQRPLKEPAGAPFRDLPDTPPAGKNVMEPGKVGPIPGPAVDFEPQPGDTRVTAAGMEVLRRYAIPRGDGKPDAAGFVPIERYEDRWEPYPGED